MYQVYHGITDTKQPFPPLLNEFFFGGFLKHRTTMSYGTFYTSGLSSEESKVKPKKQMRSPGDLKKKGASRVVHFWRTSFKEQGPPRSGEGSLLR
jgi:hypothetical protein